jgi:type 1 glutamine amidotransferase
MRSIFLLFLSAAALLAQTAPKKILYVTHSAGFRHTCLELSQQTLTTLATDSGKLQVDVTEDLSRITAQNLANYDALFFFTSGELELSDQQKADLLDFIRSGKGFGGVHSATDTLYTWPAYGEMIGGIFDGHPWTQTAAIDVEDPEHPVSRPLAPAWTLQEEFYQFRSFSRENVRVLMTLDMRSVDLHAAGVNRGDEDFALTWVRPYGQGRVFYTALGHFEETWQDPRFQQLMLNAMLWTTGLVEGDDSLRPLGPTQAALPEAVSPGAALEIYGANLTTGSTMVSNALDWRYRLAGARVRVGGRDAPFYYASPVQLNVQFPMELTAGSMAPVEIIVGNRSFAAGQVPVVAATPVIRAVVSRLGFLEIYATGLGKAGEAIATGAPAPLDRLVHTEATPVVRVGGREATLQFSGLAPGWVALYQVNAMLPADLPAGDAEIELEIAGRTARFPLPR